MNDFIFEYNEPFYVDVDEKNNGERVDKYLADMLSSFSRSQLQKLIKDEKVQVASPKKGAGMTAYKPVKANYKLTEGETISLIIPEPEELRIEPENIPLDILYEDDDLIVVNKPKGMVVHPAPGHYTGTLVNALMYHCRDNLSGINGVLRPGIVHRIDMDTTGALVVCKNDLAHQALSEQLKVHSITRHYEAICYGTFKELNGTVDAPLGRNPSDRKKMAIVSDGKHAVTHYEVLQSFSKFSYIRCTLETGRTHQIRVHMASIGHPLLGDELYSPFKSPYKLQGQTLHARILGFNHPRTGEYMEFEAPLPYYFTQLLCKINS